MGDKFLFLLEMFFVRLLICRFSLIWDSAPLLDLGSNPLYSSRLVLSTFSFYSLQAVYVKVKVKVKRPCVTSERSSLKEAPGSGSTGVYGS